MPTVEELQEKAVKYFCTRPVNFPTGRPFNCCESIMMALKDHLGIESDLIPGIGTGIGAGVSLNGLLCGSISGPVLLIGAKHGRTRPEESPIPVWSMVDRYVTEFKDVWGATTCRELTRLDVKNPEQFKEYYARVHDYACADRIRYAVKKTLEMLLT